MLIMLMTLNHADQWSEITLIMIRMPKGYFQPLSLKHPNIFALGVILQILFALLARLGG